MALIAQYPYVAFSIPVLIGFCIHQDCLRIGVLAISTRSQDMLVVISELDDRRNRLQVGRLMLLQTQCLIHLSGNTSEYLVMHRYSLISFDSVLPTWISSMFPVDR